MLLAGCLDCTRLYLLRMTSSGGNFRQDLNADARLAAIVDSSYDAIISKDLKSIITSWNYAAERMFGYSAEEAVGRSMLVLIPERLHDEETNIIARISQGQGVASFDTTRKRKDGSLLAVSITVSPIRNASGHIVGASTIARDITAAKDSERRIRLLMREVNHRVKNQFAVILSMVRETSKRSTDPSEFEELIRARIMALSRSHDLLVTSEWAGASLFDLIQEHLKPFGHEERISLSGPLLTLQSNAVQNLGMAFHELGTNSSKYGALAGEGGHIEITWKVESGPEAQRRFHLLWHETSSEGGTARQTTERKGSGERKGFGTVVLQRVAPQSLSGSSTLERLPDGVKWALDAPLEAIVVPQLGADTESDFSV